MRIIAQANLTKSDWQPPEPVRVESEKIGVVPHVFEVAKPLPPRASEWTLRVRMNPGHFVQFNNFVVYADQPFTVYMHMPEQMAFGIVRAIKSIRDEATDVKHIHMEWNDGCHDLVSLSRGCVAHSLTNNTAPFGYSVWFDLGWR